MTELARRVSDESPEEQLDSDGPSSVDRRQRFAELWPLHALRYAMIVAGVAAWLWEGTAAGGRALAVALFVSVVMLSELGLYGPRPTRAVLLTTGAQLAAALGAFGYQPGFPMVLILTAVVAGAAATLNWPWALGASVMAVAGPVSAAMLDGGARSSPFLLPGLFLMTSAAALGRLVALRLEERCRHQRVVAELEDAQARLSRMAAAARELARAEEHRRLSEELHDALGHALVGTLLQVQLARKLVKSDADAADQRLELVEKSVRETLERVRHALRRGQRGIEALPLHLALESLAAEFRAFGGPEVSVSFRPDGESVSDLSPEVREALLRTVQEALTNSVRHGKARHIEIEAEAAGPRVYLTIRDDGEGADSYVPGMGLLGMIRRIQAVGGSLRFHTQAGRGFQIQVGVRRR